VCSLVTVTSLIITTACFIILFINRYSNRSCTALTILLHSKYINKFVDLKTIMFISCLDRLFQNLINTWQFIPTNFSVAVSTSEELG
jgi:hypothetical protein